MEVLKSLPVKRQVLPRQHNFHLYREPDPQEDHNQ